VPVALEVTLVQVEFSVTPVVLEDRYQIKITQTFETNVPTPVIVTEPPGVSLPNLKPGEVLNGEFTITNYGLISADFKAITFPPSIGDYDLELLANMPKTLKAAQKVVVPYRIARRQNLASHATGTENTFLASALYDEVAGFGGGNCAGSGAVTSSWEGIICPNTENARTVTKDSNFTVSYNNCTASSSPAGTGGTTQPPTYSSSTGGGGSQSSGGDSNGATATALPEKEEDIICIIPIPCVGSQCDEEPDGDGPVGLGPVGPPDSSDPGDPTDPTHSDPPESDPPGPPPPDPPGPDGFPPAGPPGDPPPPPQPNPSFPPGNGQQC
jgi:hypothetical protein